MRAYFDWDAEGLELSRPLESSLQASVAGLLENFKVWHLWDDYARPEVRASRAVAKVWEARQPGPRQLAEAAWACRAAWSASDAFSLAVSDALLEFLRASQVQEFSRQGRDKNYRIRRPSTGI
jgi:hypothetical protein